MEIGREFSMTARVTPDALGRVVRPGLLCGPCQRGQAAAVASASDLYLSWSTPHSDAGMSVRGPR